MSSYDRGEAPNFEVLPLHGHWVGDHEECSPLGCPVARQTPPEAGSEATPQIDLVSWLTEQIDQDEQVARTCGSRDWARPAFAEWLHQTAGFGWAETQNVIIHDPARALRQVAAYRRILVLHASDRGGCRACWEPGSDYAQVGNDMGMVDWPCPTVRSLASVYSDRPGFDPSWTVE